MHHLTTINKHVTAEYLLQLTIPNVHFQHFEIKQIQLNTQYTSVLQTTTREKTLHECELDPLCQQQCSPKFHDELSVPTPLNKKHKIIYSLFTNKC